MLSKHLILCCPLLLLPSISIRVFPNELAICIKWPSYWSFSFSYSPSNKYSALISFRIDSFDLLEVQGTLNSSSIIQKASVLWYSAFFMGQLLHLYSTTGKTTALAIWNFAGEVRSLLFNMLSRFAIVFLSRSKCLLISWLQFTVRSDFGAQENKVCHCFHFLPLYLPWSDGTKCHDLSFFHVEFQASFFALLFQPHQDSL